MTRTRFVPMLRFRLRDSLGSVCIFFGIYMLVMLVFLAVCNIAEGRGSVAAYAISAGITMLVFGICSIREDLRIALQHGVSRRSALAAEVTAAFVMAAVLAVAGELLMAVCKAMVAGRPGIEVNDIFQLVFSEQWDRGGFLPYLQECVCNLFAFLLAYLGGSFISLMFYRLRKVWTAVVGVAIPVFILFGIPLLAESALGAVLAVPLKACFTWALSSPWRLILIFIAQAAVAAFLNWLLIRRAPVKAAK